MLLSRSTIVTSIFSAAARAQVTGLGRYGCQPDSGISVLPACDALNATLHSCFGTVERPILNETCFCKQDVLNSVFDCESEFRLCYQNDRFDYYPASVASNWHDQCDTYIAFTPTTPVLSNPPTTRPTVLGGSAEAYCTDLLTSCAIWTSALGECWVLDYDVTASSALECACSTSLLSLASVCLYDGNVTCLGTNADLKKIALFDICRKTYSKGQMVLADTTPSVLSQTSTTVAPRTTTSMMVSQTSTAGPDTGASTYSTSSTAAQSAVPSSAQSTVQSMTPAATFTGSAGVSLVGLGHCGAVVGIVLALLLVDSLL